MYGEPLGESASDGGGEAAAHADLPLIAHWGFVESKSEYYAVLANADVVVSTADHEFFGVLLLG